MKTFTITTMLYIFFGVFVQSTLTNVLGREVAVLMNETQTAGEHHVTFDAAGLASGVYLCRIEAGKFAQTRKLILLK